MQFFFDQPRNLLIYDRPSPLVLQHTQGAREVNGQYVAVPRTLRNSQVLRWLNYPVMPVITDKNYDWPIEPNKTPLIHQKMMANFGVLHPRMFNLSDMGTMKTLATLWAADWLMKQHPDGTFRALIVAPLSILERVWANALFANFLSRRTFQILYGSAEKRLEQLAQPADFYIINFDGVGVGAHTRKRFELDGLSKTLAERDDIRLAIVDEASGYRDSTTKRHRIARQVIGKRQYLWMLTGTPTPNAPTDAYGLAKMVNNSFGKSFTSFREETMMKISNFKWVPRTGGYDLARRLLNPSIRFDIKQVWDGPELTTQQRQVELTAEQKKLFANLKRDLQVVVRSGQPITAANEAAVRTKFIQISLGGIYDANHVSHAVDAKPRLDELKVVLEQAPAKTIIFVGLTNIVNMLYKDLKKRWTCEVVNGHTSQKDRSRIFQDFQERDDPRILIADPGTASHGLDLYAAQTVVWFGPTDKTELYLQANRRAHRPGQRFPVTIVQLVSNKLEAEIYRRLETNTTLQGALLDLVRKGEF
jgi:SNF2 family DNA or RNA helicase